MFLGPFKVSVEGYQKYSKLVVKIDGNIYTGALGIYKWSKDEGKFKKITDELTDGNIPDGQAFYIRLENDFDYSKVKKWHVTLVTEEATKYKARMILMYAKANLSQNLAYYVADSYGDTDKIKWGQTIDPTDACLKIIKKDKETGESLGGAEFRIIDNQSGEYVVLDIGDNGGTYKGITSNEYESGVTFAVPKEGFVVSDVPCNKSYTVIEMVPPSSDTAGVIYLIDKDTKEQTKTLAAVNDEDNPLTFTFEDTRVDVTGLVISKKDIDTLEFLDGGKFIIREADSDSENCYLKLKTEVIGHGMSSFDYKATVSDYGVSRNEATEFQMYEGQFIIDNLEPGNYVIEEIDAPWYDDEIQYKVVNQYPTYDSETYVQVIEGEYNSVDIYNEADIPVYPIEIHKKDSETGNGIGGTKFKIKSNRTDKYVKLEVTTDEEDETAIGIVKSYAGSEDDEGVIFEVPSGGIRIDELKKGEYTVIEVSPPDTGEDSTMYLIDEREQKKQVPSENDSESAVVFEFTDTKIEKEGLIIYKKKAAGATGGEELLDGGKFVIKDASTGKYLQLESGVDKGETTINYYSYVAGTVDTQAQATQFSMFYGMYMIRDIEPGNYIIEELEAPKDSNGNSYIISNNGKTPVEIVSGVKYTPVIIFNYEDSLIESGSLTIKKVDIYDNTKELAGAQFKIKSQSSGKYLDITIDGNSGVVTDEESESGTIFTVPSGGLTISDMSVGNYEIEEVKAPEGYMICYSSVMVSITKNQTTTEIIENIPEITPKVIKVDDRKEKKGLTDVGFTFKATIQTYDATGGGGYSWVDHEMVLTAAGKWSETGVAGIYKTDSEHSIEIKGEMPKTTVKYYNEEGEEIYSAEVSGRFKQGSNIIATEVLNGNYGYNISANQTALTGASNYIGNGQYTIPVSSGTANIELTNHQWKVKLSGYVWLDGVEGKSSINNDQYDSGNSEYDNQDTLMNGITVYLVDSAGNQVCEPTTTGNWETYSKNGGTYYKQGEISNGLYVFKDVDLDKIEAGDYHIEFEYNGVLYQSVNANLNVDRGSKAIDTTSRAVLDAQFTNLSSELRANGDREVTNNHSSATSAKVIYGSYSNYESSATAYENCEVRARTKEAGYNIYDSYRSSMEEIPNINLGLYKKAQTDYRLETDEYNMRIDVNKFAHIYKYDTKYKDNGAYADVNSYYQTKFDKGHTYTRNVYESDVNASESTGTTTEDMKIYLTYKVKLVNDSVYDGRIDSIVAYSKYYDGGFTFDSGGTQINDDTAEISGQSISVVQSDVEINGEKYNKYIISNGENSTAMNVSSGSTTYVYLKYKITRETALTLLDQDPIYNYIEINSYTTYYNGTTRPVAVYDVDSVPGNMDIGNSKYNYYYEDDNDFGRGMQLKPTGNRNVSGTTFVDSITSVDNVEGVNENQERRGNGEYDSSDKSLAGVTVKLLNLDIKDSNGNPTIAKLWNEGTKAWDIEAMTTTDDNGNYTFSGYVPGNYVIQYTWGDDEYKVQYYKSTTYDKTRVNYDGTQKGDPGWYDKEDYDEKETYDNGTSDFVRYIDGKIEQNVNYNDNDNRGYVHYWWRDDNVGTRKQDAVDLPSQRIAIDNEMSAIKYNYLEDLIEKAYKGRTDAYIPENANNITYTRMDSATPVMSFSIETDTSTTEENDGLTYTFDVSNIDFGIVERAKQKLEMGKRISHFTVTLANGQVLVDAEVDEDGNLSGATNHTSYGKPSVTDPKSNGIAKVEMDNELIEGATVEIRYEIYVKNVGELDYTTKEYYYYGIESEDNKVKVSVTELADYIDRNLQITSEVGTDKDAWLELDTEDFKGKYFEEHGEKYLDHVRASEKDNNKYSSDDNASGYLDLTRTYVTEQMSKDLAPSEKKIIYLDVSKELTSTDDNTFDNKAEITEVTKGDTNFASGIPVEVTIVDNKTFKSFNVSNAETFIVIPSTGEDRSYSIYIIIGIATLAILGTGVIAIRRFVVKGK